MSLKLPVTALALLGLYATAVACTSLTVLLLLFFGWTRQLPSEFAKERLGRVARWLGFLTKALPRLVVMLHYIVLIVILVLIGQVANG